MNNGQLCLGAAGFVLVILVFVWFMRKVKGAKRSMKDSKAQARKQEEFNQQEWLQATQQESAMPGVALILTALEKGTATTAGGKTVDLVQMVGDLTADGTQLASLQTGVSILETLSDMGASPEEARDIFRALKPERPTQWTSPGSGGGSSAGGKPSKKTPSNRWGVDT